MSSAEGRKALVGVGLLAGVWIGVYWLWEPTPPGDDAPPIRFDAPPDALDDQGAAEGGAEAMTSAPPTDLPDADPVAHVALAPGEGGTLEELMRRAAKGDAPLDGPASPRADAPGAEPPRAAEDDDAPLIEDGVLVPTYSEYVVKEGDELFGIAERLYGQTRHWQAIAKSNDFDPMKPLRVGQVLRIPDDPNNLQGIPVDPETGEPVDRPAPVLVEPEPTAYTVVSGDNLSRIAQMFYGRATLWRRIYDANRDVLDTPDSLQVGMKLTIPPPPNTEARADGGDGE